MGAWGPALYSDDIADDVRSEYKDILRKGKTDADALKELLNENREILEDPDDGPVFWFALADTMWKLGRLDPIVKEKALYYLNEGGNLRRWEEENPKFAGKRKAVLDGLREQILAPQPDRKKILIPKVYHCEWELGGVYAYPFESEIALQKGFQNKVLLIQKVAEGQINPGNHVLPVCRLKITDKNAIPKTKQEFDALSYLQFERAENIKKVIEISKWFYSSCEERYGQDANRMLKLHRLRRYYDWVFINTSKRIIPKSIFYIGNFGLDGIDESGFLHDLDYSCNCARWNFFDEVIINKLINTNSDVLSGNNSGSILRMPILRFDDLEIVIDQDYYCF